MKNVKGLVLAGGQSSRMKQDKASLQFHGKSLREIAAAALSPWAEEVYLSLRYGQSVFAWDPDLLIYDELSDIGPAAALLAAHKLFPESAWLVLACDFPFVTEDAVGSLWKAHSGSHGNPVGSLVTCFQHPDETPEPLFAIWQPAAFVKLKENVSRGIQGPLQTLKQCLPTLIVPENPQWLRNTNTPEEWAEALRLKK